MTDTTLAQGLADRLRRDILRGVLPPGSVIKERDQASALGVSRTPMREAIRILAQEGLVQLRPARSPVVANPSLKEVTDDFTVLIALETLSGQLACTEASDAEIAGISAIHDRLSEEFGQVDPLDLFETDMAFHRAIAAASHNASLAATHGEYLSRLWRNRYLTARQRQNRERVVAQHAAILHALQDRDPAGIVTHVGHHLQGLIEGLKHLAASADEAEATPARKTRDAS